MAAARGPTLARYRLVIARNRAATGAVLAAAWSALPAYDEDQVAAYAARTASALAGAKASTVASSAAFYARMLLIPAPSVSAATVATLPAVRDPFLATWHALAEGRPYPDAVEVGRSTARAVGETFIQSTARQTGDAVAATVDRDVRFERVAEAGCCAWCAERDGGIYLTASDGDYGHDRCNCDVVPTS